MPIEGFLKRFMQSLGRLDHDKITASAQQWTFARSGDDAGVCCVVPPPLGNDRDTRSAAELLERARQLHEQSEELSEIATTLAHEATKLRRQAAAAQRATADRHQIQKQKRSALQHQPEPKG